MVTRQPGRAEHVDAQAYRQLFDLAPIGIVIVKPSANPVTILEFNRQAALMYGYTAGELTGMPVVDLAPEDSKPAFQSMLQRARHGQTVTAETIHRHRDGTRFPVRVNAVSWPDDLGRMTVTVEDTTIEWLRRSEAEAIDSERRRIAHEIHDSVAQSLGALRFRSALWHRLADADPAGMHAALDELQNELAAAIANIRGAIFALRPMNLDTLGFFPALKQWVADFGAQNQLLTRLHISSSAERLPAAYELPLIRVIQEALSNIRQHARASTAQVFFTLDAAGAVVVTVRDDGNGFDPTRIGAADQSMHFGLPHIRERVRALGGTIDIRSEIGHGTELTIHLPPVEAGWRAAGYQGPERRSAARRRQDRDSGIHG